MLPDNFLTESLEPLLAQEPSFEDPNKFKSLLEGVFFAHQKELQQLSIDQRLKVAGVFKNKGLPQLFDAIADGGYVREIRLGLDDYKFQSNAPKEWRRSCEKEIATLQGLLEAFEATYPISELYAMTDSKQADSPIRKSARDALGPIVTLLNDLKNKTDITPERYAEIRVRYRYATLAVGVQRADGIHHS